MNARAPSWNQPAPTTITGGRTSEYYHRTRTGIRGSLGQERASLSAPEELNAQPRTGPDWRTYKVLAELSSRHISTSKKLTRRPTPTNYRLWASNNCNYCIGFFPLFLSRFLSFSRRQLHNYPVTGAILAKKTTLGVSQ